MNKSLSFTLIFSSAALIFAAPQVVFSRPVAQRLGYPVVPNSLADALVCYMETPQGVTLNLESICGANSTDQNPNGLPSVDSRVQDARVQDARGVPSTDTAPDSTTPNNPNSPNRTGDTTTTPNNPNSPNRRGDTTTTPNNPNSPNRTGDTTNGADGETLSTPDRD
ncbi:hypothetical protein [Coleofasciculus sp.]|uniref:hypothetical protein n=1 Tax=Coleofasciculus sp. TaxID=3100458 RepID=UPI0039F8A67F